MFDFIKISCDVTKTDLTDFFDQWGFFVVGKMSINDYDHYEFNVTQQMVDNTKSYIASNEYITPNVPLVSLTNVPDISLLNVPLFTGCN